MSKNKIYIISDSIGETAEKIALATIEQFEEADYDIKRFPYITSTDQVDEIFEDICSENVIVLFTVVIEELNHHIIEKCNQNDIEYVDLINPLLDKFSHFFSEEPMREAGIIHKLNERYFEKIDAIEFAVKYDDGKDPRGIKKADIVLIGISRTSKTPLSMYLAHKHINVANIPLVPEVPVPKELFEIPSNKIIGLITDPRKLNEIRIERLKALGLETTASYADMNRILEELEYSEAILSKLKCKVINVAGKAIEETANIIEEHIKAQKED